MLHLCCNARVHWIFDWPARMMGGWVDKAEKGGIKKELEPKSKDSCCWTTMLLWWRRIPKWPCVGCFTILFSLLVFNCVNCSVYSQKNHKFYGTKPGLTNKKKNTQTLVTLIKSRKRRSKTREKTILRTWVGKIVSGRLVGCWLNKELIMIFSCLQSSFNKWRKVCKEIVWKA